MSEPAVAGDQGTIAMLDLATGVLLGEPLRGAGSAYDIAFASDGLLASAGESGLILWDPVLWTGDPAVMTETLCAVVGRDLTRAEWGQFLAGYPYHATCTSTAG